MATVLAQMVRSRWVPVVFLIGVAALPLLPRGGFGFPVCTVKLITGFPCPGCGLTRSLICMGHADLAGAARMNPVGLLLFPLFVALALISFVPGGRREPIAVWLERRATPANAAALGLAALLVLYGALRVLWMIWRHEPSIW